MKKYLLPALLILFTAIRIFTFTCKLEEPKPLTVIKSNLIRLRASVENPPSQIREIRFLGSYVSEEGHDITGEFLGKSRSSPYEIIWNCKNIPDQTWFKPAIEVETKSGEICRYAFSGGTENIIIDRQPLLKTMTWQVKPRPKQGRITIDGNTDDWKELSWNEFKTTDNVISFCGMWDKECLYLLIQVADRYLFARKEKEIQYYYGPQTAGYKDFWVDDYMEICFDINHDHTEIKGKDDPEIHIAADGEVQAFFIDIREKKITRFNPPVQAGVQVKGTLNNADDVDSGYVVEVKIPWKAIQLTPAAGGNMGFDIFNNDVDRKDGGAVFSSWSGLTKNVNDNPTEWGNLELIQEQSMYLKTGTIVLVCCSLLVLIGLLRTRKKAPKRRSKQALKAYPPAVQKTIDGLKSNIEGKVDFQQMAEQAGISYSALRQSFKKETGMTLKDYQTDLRIEHAKKLLLNRQKSISEIAYMYGYANPGDFSKVFKKKVGKTPKDFVKNP
jgi:AraC-like DNA-binding protein